MCMCVCQCVEGEKEEGEERKKGGELGGRERKNGVKNCRHCYFMSAYLLEH